MAAYQAVWSAKREAIADDAARPETAEAFRASYPLHPEVLQTLTSKTATLDTFQRVRGMLRLLERTIAQLWETRPADATAIHLHHVDPGCEPVRQEIVTRLQLVEQRVLKRLARVGVKLGSPARRMTRGYALTEDLALTLGLLFRALAPMRSRDNMRAVAEGIEAMGREEAAYWLGMAMHRRRPRRVLTALRMLLTEPRPRGGERSL